MAGYLLKLLFLSGKYLTKVALTSLNQVSTKSSEIHSRLLKQFEDVTSVVKYDKNMFERINDNVYEPVIKEDFEKIDTKNGSLLKKLSEVEFKDPKGKPSQTLCGIRKSVREIVQEIEDKIQNLNESVVITSKTNLNSNKIQTKRNVSKAVSESSLNHRPCNQLNIVKNPSDSDFTKISKLLKQNSNFTELLTKSDDLQKFLRRVSLPKLFKYLKRLNSFYMNELNSKGEILSNEMLHCNEINTILKLQLIAKKCLEELEKDVNKPILKNFTDIQSQCFNYIVGSVQSKNQFAVQSSIFSKKSHPYLPLNRDYGINSDKSIDEAEKLLEVNQSAFKKLERKILLQVLDISPPTFDYDNFKISNIAKLQENSQYTYYTNKAKGFDESLELPDSVDINYSSKSKKNREFSTITSFLETHHRTTEIEREAEFRHISKEYEKQYKNDYRKQLCELIGSSSLHQFDSKTNTQNTLRFSTSSDFTTPLHFIQTKKPIQKLNESNKDEDEYLEAFETNYTFMQPLNKEESKEFFTMDLPFELGTILPKNQNETSEGLTNSLIPNDLINDRSMSMKSADKNDSNKPEDFKGIERTLDSEFFNRFNIGSLRSEVDDRFTPYRSTDYDFDLTKPSDKITKITPDFKDLLNTFDLTNPDNFIDEDLVVSEAETNFKQSLFEKIETFEDNQSFIPDNYGEFTPYTSIPFTNPSQEFDLTEPKEIQQIIPKVPELDKLAPIVTNESTVVEEQRARKLPEVPDLDDKFSEFDLTKPKEPVKNESTVAEPPKPTKLASLEDSLAKHYDETIKILDEITKETRLKKWVEIDTIKSRNLFPSKNQEKTPKDFISTSNLRSLTMGNKPILKEPRKSIHQHVGTNINNKKVWKEGIFFDNSTFENKSYFKQLQNQELLNHVSKIPRKQKNSNFVSSKNFDRSKTTVPNLNIVIKQKLFEKYIAPKTFSKMLSSKADHYKVPPKTSLQTPKKTEKTALKGKMSFLNKNSASEARTLKKVTLKDVTILPQVKEKLKTTKSTLVVEKPKSIQIALHANAEQKQTSSKTGIGQKVNEFNKLQNTLPKTTSFPNKFGHARNSHSKSNQNLTKNQIDKLKNIPRIINDLHEIKDSTGTTFIKLNAKQDILKSSSYEDDDDEEDDEDEILQQPEDHFNREQVMEINQKVFDSMEDTMRIVKLITSEINQTFLSNPTNSLKNHRLFVVTRYCNKQKMREFKETPDDKLPPKPTVKSNFELKLKTILLHYINLESENSYRRSNIVKNVENKYDEIFSSNLEDNTQIIKMKSIFSNDSLTKGLVEYENEPILTVIKQIDRRKLVENFDKKHKSMMNSKYFEDHLPKLNSILNQHYKKNINTLHTCGICTKANQLQEPKRSQVLFQRLYNIIERHRASKDFQWSTNINLLTDWSEIIRNEENNESTNMSPIDINADRSGEITGSEVFIPPSDPDFSYLLYLSDNQIRFCTTKNPEPESIFRRIKGALSNIGAALGPSQPQKKEIEEPFGIKSKPSPAFGDDPEPRADVQELDRENKHLETEAGYGSSSTEEGTSMDSGERKHED